MVLLERRHWDGSSLAPLLDLQDGWRLGSEDDHYLAHGMVSNCLFPCHQTLGGYEPN